MVGIIFKGTDEYKILEHKLKEKGIKFQYNPFKINQMANKDFVGSINIKDGKVVSMDSTHNMHIYKFIITMCKKHKNREYITCKDIMNNSNILDKYVVHKEPELIYCLQDSSASFYKVENTNPVPIKLLREGVCYNKNLYDLILCDSKTTGPMYTVWLGYWNEGLKKEQK